MGPLRCPQSLVLSNNAATGGTCFGDSGGPNFVGDSLVVGRVTSFGLNGSCGGTGGSPRGDRRRARFGSIVIGMEELGELRLEQRLDSGGEFAFFRAMRASHPHRAVGTPCVVLRCSRSAAEQRWPPWADPAVARVLCHPTIVQMLDAGEAGGWRYFSFEQVDGVDLRHLLRGEPLPRNVAMLVTRTIVDALCVASEAVGLDGNRFTFLHGAIAARWVFVARTGEVKLGGFGLGYIKPERQRGLHEMISAPEQLSGSQGETAEVDIFQVGLLLHRMLFASEFVSEALARILEQVSGRSVAPTALPAADSPLERLLRQLLAERPEERFTSIHEVRAAIDALPQRGESERAAHAWLATAVEHALGAAMIP